MKTIKLSDIIVPKYIKESEPSEYKMDCRRKWWNKNRTQQKWLVLDRDNVLLDGYIQYLILKENNVEEAKFIRRKSFGKDENRADYRTISTTYIYGVHINSNCNKEFCWRVPASWSGWEKNLQIGDTILCRTKFGFSPVIVTRIEVLDKCPVDFKVKKVARMEIRRDGIIVEA